MIIAPKANPVPIGDETSHGVRPTVIATPRTKALFPGWGVRI